MFDLLIFGKEFVSGNQIGDLGAQYLADALRYN
jgi:hypothetical protein